MIYFLTILSISTSTLLSVVEVCRHGARQTLQKYPWNNYDWEVNTGELAHEGLIQHYLIGRELRDRYSATQPLLPHSYNLDKIYIRSSDTPRTIMSAQAQMFGLFPHGPSLSKTSNQYTATPPFEIPDINNTIKANDLHALPYDFQPVTIEVQPLEQDQFLAVFGYSCPRMQFLINEFEHSPKYKQRIEAYNKNIKSRLEQVLNLKEIKYQDVAQIADSFECIEFAGFGRAKDLIGDIYDEILEIRNYTNAYMFEGSEALNLANSYFFKEALDNFQSVIDGNGARIFSLYMGHDTNLVGYLKRLNAYDGNNPPFASALIFELHEEEEKEEEGEKHLFVRVFYNDKQLKLDFCELDCGFKKFKDFINSWTYPDLSKACLLQGRLQQDKYNYFLNLT